MSVNTQPYTSTPLARSKKRLAQFVCLFGFSLASAFAQLPPEPKPVPAAWQALGLPKWPDASPQLGLSFDEIVLPGKVAIRLRSNVQFTQKLVLFSYSPGTPDKMTELANFSLSPKTAPELSLSINATATQNMVLLAQTPAGWLMVERQLKVGKKQQ